MKRHVKVLINYSRFRNAYYYVRPLFCYIKLFVNARRVLDTKLKWLIFSVTNEWKINRSFSSLLSTESSTGLTDSYAHKHSAFNVRVEKLDQFRWINVQLWMFNVWVTASWSEQQLLLSVWEKRRRRAAAAAAALVVLFGCNFQRRSPWVVPTGPTARPVGTPETKDFNNWSFFERYETF